MTLQRELVQQLEDSLSNEPQKPFGLIVIDIFDFHEFVLDYGFNTVSDLIDRVHSRLRALTNDWTENYLVGRSTFAVTLNEQDDPEQIAYRLLDYINRPYLVNGLIVNLKTSIGMALDPTYSLSSFDLLDNACTATRHAEIDRFKSVYLFEPEMENHRVQHRKIRTDLRKAISQISPHADHMFKTSSFEVVYQPKVDLSTRKLLGFEALLRWQHPIYGPVSPEIFIPICEEIGLINVLGGWVIQIACQDASQWPLPSDQEHLSVAVNLSPAQLSDRDLLLTSISSAIESSSLSPETLEFELTERDFHDTFHDVINEIKSLGCKLSIDDFGVKYSSLSRLKEVPFDSLKIDRSFIKDIGEDTPQPNRDRALWMLRNIALLGKSLRLKVIAEGVETEEQAMLALGAGCSIMQGYLVSRPIKAADVNQFISEYANQHSGEHIYEP